jgi:hypothetical protein
MIERLRAIYDDQWFGIGFDPCHNILIYFVVGRHDQANANKLVAGIKKRSDWYVPFSHLTSSSIMTMRCWRPTASGTSSQGLGNEDAHVIQYSKQPRTCSMRRWSYGARKAVLSRSPRAWSLLERRPWLRSSIDH